MTRLDPLREAARRVVDTWQSDPDGAWVSNDLYAAIAGLRAALDSPAAPPDGDRPPLPAETIAYDKGVMDGYLAAKKDYSPGGMYASRAAPRPEGRDS